MTMLVNPEEVVLATASVQETPRVVLQDPAVFTAESVGAAVAEANSVVDGGKSNQSMKPPLTSSAAVDSGSDGRDQGQHGEEIPSPQMKAPHISTVYHKQDVMLKHFGVTQTQALRTQALVRLGVTEEDVRIAERLMGSRSETENAPSKEEWLLGVTYAQMSFHKALQVLGISEAVVEEERSKRLGELGLGGWTPPPESTGCPDGEDKCAGFFTKKRRSVSHELGTTLPGEVAFAPTHTRVLQLEEVCHSQMTRIQELENQLAALSARPSPSAP